MRKGKFLTGGNRIPLFPAKKRVDANPSVARFGTEPVYGKCSIVKTFHAGKIHLFLIFPNLMSSYEVTMPKSRIIGRSQ